jgi:hypothetical protein
MVLLMESVQKSKLLAGHNLNCLAGHDPNGLAVSWLEILNKDANQL